ncbi:MAG: outer membrane protein assembly factor BamB [Verrucomicrobiales bacterium]|jgi:outer membrane protein assembly factor BamB
MKFIIATLLAATALQLAAAPPSEWNQWRGPNRDGTLPSKASWPDSVQSDKLVKIWSQELAEGYSGPILSKNLVFSVETKDKQDEITRAFDRKSGKQLWESSWEGSMKVPFFAAKNGSWTRSTPVCDAESVYVGGMRDVLVCINIADGKERWRIDFPEQEDTPAPGFGFASSPMLDGDHLYVQAGAAVMKLDKRTGKKIWSAMQDKREMYGSAFSSPTIGTLKGKRQLLVQTRTMLAGLDLDDGKVLWDYEVKAFRGMNILTPTVVGDSQVFTSSYGGGCFMFDIAKDGDNWRATKKWVNKVEAYMASPNVIGKHIYFHGRDKRFHCVDLETGEEAWKSEEKFGEYWSTIANGDKILALDERGEILLVQADPKELKIIDRNRISKSPTWAHIAIAGSEIYVRDLKGITKFKWQ